MGPGIRMAPQAMATASSTVKACARAAATAGFSFTRTAAGYPQIVVAVAIAMAESSCNPGATFINGNGCADRGLWQIDNCAWPNVSNNCAYTSQCNADAAYGISSHGGNWGPWSTFNSGVWRNYISVARSAVSGAVSGLVLQLENQQDRTCLDADAAQARSGGLIFQWKCNSSDRFQQWQVIGASSKTPILKNVGAGTCLDAISTGVGNAALIRQWKCNSSDRYQQWAFAGAGVLSSGARVTARSAGAGTCLDADGGKAGTADPIWQWKCSAADRAQQWNLS
jgi:hypothetical protein